ncbi:MAG: hypothetical protein NVSMB18_14000 [Acetobacteraceae bacterium]
MRDVLIDVRCLQDPSTAASDAGRRARAMLGEARGALVGWALIGLIEPGLPALPGEVADLLDQVRSTAVPGSDAAPCCFVQLAPFDHDPLFVARLLDDPAVASAAVVPVAAAAPAGVAARLRRAVAGYWLSRYGRVLPADGFWAAVAGLARPAAPRVGRDGRARVALLAPAGPGGGTRFRAAVAAALGDRVELHVFGERGSALPPGAASVQRLTALPLLSRRFDRVVGVVANGARHAEVAALLARYGGRALVGDACVLAAYADERGRSLAAAELGRGVDAHEIRHWRAGTIRPGALFLGELAVSTEPLLVHSSALAAEIGRRYGRSARVLPLPFAPGGAGRDAGACGSGEVVIAAFEAGRMGKACVWALEMLRFWGVEARLHFVGSTPAGWAAVWGLCTALGLAGRVALLPAAGPMAADIGLFLAVRGQGSLTMAAAAAALDGMRLVASVSVAEGFDASGWVRTVPDQPSPPLLAEAVMALLAAGRPEAGARQAFADGHGPARFAASLCEALALDG